MMRETDSNPTARLLPRRDRIAVLAELFGVTLLAWLYLVEMATGMVGMPASDMTGGGAAMQLQPWTVRDAALMFAMWAVMMVGMMVPTAAPMTLVYAAVARKAAREGTVLAPTAVFVLGYVAMWTGFSAGATAAQWGLERAALLSPMLVTTSPTLGAALLIGAGIYQLTPFKNACLEHCRSPAYFISEHWRPGASGAFRMGLVHGAYCLGCCWILMGLLFFGGVMNLLWIAGITVFVLLEKVAPFGAWGGRVAGLVMIGTGLFAAIAAR
jgi:predicted metal-binding membrane protein